MNPRIPHHKAVMVARASIISKSEVSITVLCLLCSPRYTTVQIMNCSKTMSVTTVATMKIWWSRAPQLSSETEVFIVFLCQLCSTRYTAVRIKNFSKSTFVIKVVTMKKYGQFLLQKESIMWYHQIDTFYCQQRWRQHKGGHW